jgi:hypothetical protein
MCRSAGQRLPGNEGEVGKYEVKLAVNSTCRLAIDSRPLVVCPPLANSSSSRRTTGQTIGLLLFGFDAHRIIVVVTGVVVGAQRRGSLLWLLVGA